MAMVSVPTDEPAKARFAQFCEGASLGRNEALGVLVQFWAETRRLGLEAAPMPHLQMLLPLAPARAGLVMEAMRQAGYVEGGAADDDRMHVVDNSGLTRRLAKRRADGSVAGLKRGKAAKRPRKPAAAAAEPRALVPARAPDKTPLELACRATWEAYEMAYRSRTGQSPIRNAKVNALVKQLVQRLGHDDAPRVITFYVQHPNRSYVERLWPLEMAVRDAEPLRTQWANGRFVTREQVSQYEATQAYEMQRQRILANEI